MSYDKLNSYYNDKLLLPIKQKELVFDNRDPGIFKTKPYNSSIVKYFIEGKGWIKEIVYERCRDNSGLSPKDYNDKYLTNVCACYIDTEGKTGTADMDVQTYDMLLEKTYSDPETSSERDRLYSIYNNRVQENAKPSEAYAVKTIDYGTDRYEIFSFDCFGNLVKVLPDTFKRAEDVNIELKYIFESRTGTADVEIIGYGELCAKSEAVKASMNDKYKGYSYMVEAFEKTAEDITHYLTKYQDEYAVNVACLKYGSYWDCNDELRKILKMHDYGYSYDMMHPIFDNGKALETYDQNKAVYLLYDDGTEALAESREEIEKFPGIFGIERMDGEPKVTPLFLSDEKEEEKKPMDTMEEFVRISHNEPDKAFDYFTDNAEKLTKSELISICRELLYYTGNTFNDKKISNDIIKSTMEKLASRIDIDLYDLNGIDPDDEEYFISEQNGGRK